MMLVVSLCSVGNDPVTTVATRARRISEFEGFDIIIKAGVLLVDLKCTGLILFTHLVELI